MVRLAILGGGFMGGALAEGLIDSGWSPSHLIVADRLAERRRHLEEHLGVPTTADVAQASIDAETVLFAVKPQDVGALLESLRAGFDSQRLVISICAGVKTATFEDALGDVPVIRAMPNTPAAIGQAATAIASGRFAHERHLATALNILSTVGKVVVVDETQMDAVTAVSGTGPAYGFYLAESMIRSAQNLGLEADQAHVLVYQTIAGAARLMMHDPAGPQELRTRVTSTGGTTQAALEHLQERDWSEIFEEAVERAWKRSKELGE